jgi:nitric oxide dioxygenase
MTPEQKQLIRESFPAIREMAGPVSLLFYGRLFALEPALRPMFRQDIELQGRKLMDMLTAVVDNLDHFEGLAPTLRALGQKHAGYGVRPEHYQTVARALMWALGQALDTQFYPELRTAWLAIIEAVSVSMKKGAAELPPA